ncbi:MAG: GNAT family N-acetyltransferase [Cellulomonas sp.]|uniref:GNAT family N-acetyltransferase n=1 Tax=Cellulomonas sp. TaxID=40001 RepID=UPI0017B42A04|nr:GNAT family protein [Cellulomonas sp.]NMM30666.1 GNAT family N-acetyltransferase [Cellulomonas sp.]
MEQSEVAQSKAAPPDGAVLANRVVRLTPLGEADADELFVALDDDRVWAAGFGGGPRGRPSNRRTMAAWIVALTGRPRQAAYAVRLARTCAAGPAGRLVGTSSLGDVDLTNSRLHLGWTAYAPDVWAGAVNPATKLALLTHAFDDCHMHRVKIQTDAINVRSQAAIARLGAVREGVLREHVVRADGTWRDTVVFSILASQWPTVRAGLEQRLDI